MRQASNELRVFISSTFRDLQEEREHLVKKIFPEIRALCRERGITFTEVDLRWGLTDEDVALGQVIRTCLEQVDKCRPYFIGITGDRYGFIPGYLDVQKDPTLLTEFPWVEDAATEEMSITEMEAHYAALDPSLAPTEGESTDRARFYFRRQRASLDDAPENDELSRLEGYQERIRKSGARVETFRDPVSLGELIYDDLIEIIRRDFADARPPTPLEEERARHDAFSLSRRRAYIANPQYLKRLNDHVRSDDPPLVVYAESGSGKSSLFAYWADQYRRKNPGAHIIEHYVGIGATATDHYAVIRHVCMEIRERFGREEEIPSEPAKLEAALGQWLGYAEHALTASDERMVLILDGLNQLQGEALKLLWIPDVISPRIRLILSSTVEGTLVELEQRGWTRFGMQALNEAEREAVVVRYLAEYHKALNPDQIRRIAADYKCGHPLYLKTLLEELRLVGRHEELDARIDDYLQTTGTEDMFQRVLERIEDDYSQRAVREVMVLLAASRSGLDERELSEISGLARLKVATMVAGLEYHLVRKEGRLTFFHDYLRRAVEKRYLSDPQKRESSHRRLAEYFRSAVSALTAERSEVPARLAGELAYQLHAAGSIDQLHECLSTMPVFLALYQKQTEYEVLGYWSAVEDAEAIDRNYRRGLENWVEADKGKRSVGVGRVVDLLERLGRWSYAIELCEERLTLAKGCGDRSEEAETLVDLGELLQLRGEYEAALTQLTRALNLGQETGDLRGVGIARRNMGIVYFRRGEYTRAQECFEASMSCSLESGDLSQVAASEIKLGSIYVRQQEFDRAIESCRTGLRISQDLGDRHSMSLAHSNLGIIYSRIEKNERAVENYRKGLQLCEKLGDRRGAAIANGNIGVIWMEQREYEQALEQFRMAAETHREIGFRYGLSYWLAATARILLELLEREVEMPEFLGAYVPDSRPESWRERTLETARKSVEECLEISEELSKPDTIFNGQIMLSRIEVAEGKHVTALQRIDEMLDVPRDDEDRGTLLYWKWKLAPDAANDVRAEAERVISSLEAENPKQEYRDALRELRSGAC